MTRFCANCGIEESGDTPIIDGLCIKCYVELKDVIKIPDTIEISTCSRCGALLVRGKWFYPSSVEEAQEIVKKIIIDAIKPGEDIVITNVIAELISPSYKKAHVYVNLLVKNMYKHLLRIDVNIKWVKGLCQLCFRRAGRSFDAVVQLRFIHIDESAKRFRGEIENIFRDYIVDVEERSNGYDIKVVSQGVAQKIVNIAKKMWKKVKVTESFGDVRYSRDGSRSGKLYISVKVINLRINDYVILNGKAYTVIDVGEEFMTVLDSDGCKKTLHIEDIIFQYEGSRSKSKVNRYSNY